MKLLHRKMETLTYNIYGLVHKCSGNNDKFLSSKTQIF